MPPRTVASPEDVREQLGDLIVQPPRHRIGHVGINRDVSGQSTHYDGEWHRALVGDNKSLARKRP